MLVLFGFWVYCQRCCPNNLQKWDLKKTSCFRLDTPNGFIFHRLIEECVCERECRIRANKHWHEKREKIKKTAVFYCLQLQILTQNSLNGIHSAAMTYKPDECAWVQTAAVVYFDWVDEITTPSMYTKNEYGNLPQWWLARAGDEWNLIASVNSLFNKLRCSCTRQFLQNANKQTVQNMKDVWMYHIYAYFVSLQNNRKSFAFENVFSYAFKHH